MVKSRHLTTIAEGIEEAKTRAQLIQLGCDHGQGYGFAKPLAPGDFWAYTPGGGNGTDAAAEQRLTT